MKRLFTLPVLLAFYCNTIFAYEYLEILDVDYWWSHDMGNIEAASFLVEPKGFYAECTLIIEFSAAEGWYDPEASLEVDMNFRLPAGSNIVDLYLWIEGEPVRADIYDRWTASLIYESIVQRRIDPAILTSLGGNEFNLKVFPLPPGGKRKVMIRYLTPIENSLQGSPLVQIPLNILRLSYEMPDKFKIAFKGGEGYHSPSIRETDQAAFSYVQDTDFGACWVSNLYNITHYSSLSMSYEQETSNNLKLSTFTDEKTGDKFYQLALDHVDVFNVKESRKAVFLIDFIAENSSHYSKRNMLDELEISISNSYSERDSFNILFSGLNSAYASDHWICGHPDTVAQLFDTFSTTLFNDYSNLPSLLIDGINFVKNHGNTGSLVLMSSSNSNGENSEANALISDFLEAIGNRSVPIHIVDLDDQYYDYNQMHFIGGQYYRGNEYFYSRLSQLTVGEYHSVRDNSLPIMLEKVNHRTAGYFKSLEVFIQTRNGYAFGNYRLSTSGSFIYNDEAFSMVGQFVGEPPFEISVFGQNSSNEVYFARDTVTTDRITQADSVIRTIWSAHKIRELLSLEQNHQVIGQILETSISERILCDYTAFLVLEPDFVISDDPQNENENWEENMWSPTAIEDNTGSMEVSLSNYPNPFTDMTTISYALPEEANVNISVYNALGQLVTVLVDEIQPGGTYVIELHASELEHGLYNCVMLIDGKAVKRIKLVLV